MGGHPRCGHQEAAGAGRPSEAAGRGGHQRRRGRGGHQRRRGRGGHQRRRGRDGHQSGGGGAAIAGKTLLSADGRIFFGILIFPLAKTLYKTKPATQATTILPTDANKPP